MNDTNECEQQAITKDIHQPENVSEQQIFSECVAPLSPEERVVGRLQVAAAPHKSLWFTPCTHSELRYNLTKRCVTGITDPMWSGELIPVLPLATTPDKFIACLDEEGIQPERRTDIWRIVFLPPHKPFSNCETIATLDFPTEPTPMWNLGWRLVSSPVPMADWFAIDRWDVDTWLPTNLLSRVILTMNEEGERAIKMQDSLYNEQLAIKSACIGALRSEADTASVQCRAALSAAQRKLGISHANADLTQRYNVALMRDVARLTDDSWLLEECMDLKARLEEEQLNKAVAEEDTVTALRQKEDYEGYNRYLQCLLRKNGIPFNATVRHGPDHSEKAA